MSVPTQEATRITDLAPGGPWVFLCREDESVVLRDVSGPGERAFDGPCFSWVAPTGDQVYAGEEMARVWDVPGLTSLMQRTFPEESLVYGAFVDAYVKWSPDGENLLLVVWSPHSPRHTLYRYRRGESTVEETGLVGEDLQIMGWSPNGRWALLLVRPEGGAQTIQAFEVPRGRISYTSRHISQGEQDTWSQLVGWLDDERVILEERHRLPDHAPGDYLRLIDLGAGTEKTLVGPIHLWGAALDPATGTLLYGLADWPDTVEEVPGIYALKVANGENRFLGLPQPDWTIPWDFPFWFMRWHPQLGLFSVEMEEGIATLNTEGVVVDRFEAADRISPSPDGEWILVEGADLGDNELYRSTGESVRTMDQGFGAWTPDSKTLFLVGDSAVYQAREADNWAPVLIPGFESMGAVVSPVQP